MTRMMLIALMAFGLAACGQESADSGSAEEAASETMDQMHAVQECSSRAELCTVLGAGRRSGRLADMDMEQAAKFLQAELSGRWR